MGEAPVPAQPSTRLRLDLPLSVVLGAGSVRGLAHVAILGVLREAGFQIAEITGTSVGAIVAAFYGAVGLDLDHIREAGLSLTTRQLLGWALLRHASPEARQRWKRVAGVIPDHIDRLSAGSFEQMHHGLSRIGFVVYDRLSKSELVCHNVNPILRLEDAVRGAAALPGLFPPWKCSFDGRPFSLVDGGLVNRLPVDSLFRPPFQPVQILAVDISSKPVHRTHNMKTIAALRLRHPQVPIEVLCPDTLGGSTILYRPGYLDKLLASARQAALAYVAQLPQTTAHGVVKD